MKTKTKRTERKQMEDGGAVYRWVKEEIRFRLDADGVSYSEAQLDEMVEEYLDDFGPLWESLDEFAKDKASEL